MLRFPPIYKLFVTERTGPHELTTPSPPIHPVHTRKSDIGNLAGLQGLVGVMASSLSTFRAASRCARQRRCHHKRQQIVALRTRTTSDSSSVQRSKEEGSRTKAQNLTRPALTTDKTTPAYPKKRAGNSRAKAQNLMRPAPAPATDKPPPPAQPYPKRACGSSSPPRP